jgi:two-component system response regulator VicR
MDASKKRILCLEDHAETCELLFAMLGKAGYELILAKTPAEVLRLARNKYFDCFILDVRLPGKSGLEICREIRVFDPSTPVIFYTGAAYDADREAGLKAGAQAYLVKPDGTDSLIETIKRFTN